MSQHHMADLVRQIRPETFSERVHGPGHRIVYSERGARHHHGARPGWLRGAGERQYFVKRWLTPKEVSDWSFQWSEGTTAIHLDFGSRFVIEANEDEHALRLVAALAEAAEPGEALYRLIDATLHKELDRLLQECESKATNLLDCFSRSSTGTGESEELNRTVGERVATLLGGCYFRIGFQLRNMPSLQIEMASQIDPFTLADSQITHHVETTVLLRLVNYQVYKKSGSASEADVIATMRRSITQAVKTAFMPRKYSAVVRTFRRGDDSIEKEIQMLIEADAASIGYHITLLQAVPNLAALTLTNPTRIDIPAREEKYYLMHSTSYVQMAIALSVQLKRECESLHLLIDPAETHVLNPIAALVKLTCRDTIQQFDREQFNLYFQSDIVPVLGEALIDRLGSYGLQTTVVHITQEPTEDAHRFQALRGRTVGFDVEIFPHANGGDADRVIMRGKIEVERVAANSWERFEGKDFGFRRDSRKTEAWQRQQAAAHGIPVAADSPLTETDRQALAIELEMAEIQERVQSTLRGSLSLIPDLAANWCTLQDSRQTIARAQALAKQAIETEFGLTVALRSVWREDLEAEKVAHLRRQKQHELERALLERDVTQRIELQVMTDERAVDDALTVRRLTLDETPDELPFEREPPLGSPGAPTDGHMPA